MSIFEDRESEVRGYCRDYPVVFTESRGSELITEDGERYIDFLGGAGTLNYGHNHPRLVEAAIKHLQNNAVLHGLDLHTTAKERFMNTFQNKILEPRGMDYKLQFTGPTGTNAVEAAMKLARKITGRQNIVSFTNGFHGMSLGALAATGNSHHRGGAGVALQGTTFLPYDGYFGPDVDTTEYIDRMLEDPSSGVDIPAAVILETIQGEGGVNVASCEWLQKIEAICRKYEIMLIVDDIQVGCGRTGTFFSFEDCGIDPDIITLSKSLGGIGLPMAVVLMRPELDEWEPGEHNGTFRGNNLAFTTAAEAIDAFWSDKQFSEEIKEKSGILRQHLQWIRAEHSDVCGKVRGRGMMYGLECSVDGLSDKVVEKAFEHKLIIESCGPNGRVIKFLGPLTTSVDELEEGLKRLATAFDEACTELKEEQLAASSK